MKYTFSLPQAIHEMGMRKNQEDSIFPKEGNATCDDRLFILCDGMGGHDAGEVASQAVCDAMSQYIKKNANDTEVFTDVQFKSAISAAYDSLDTKDNGETKKMGTTMVFLYFHRGGCFAAHIGDSRIYHLRPKTKEILYRSRDHSLVNDLYEVGEITKEEMRTSKRKNIITRAMQPLQERRAEADIVHITDIRPGDYFYLCSDGMLEQMEDEELMAIIGDDVDDTVKCKALVEATNGNSDNHSAYLLHITKVDSEEDDVLQLNDEAEARAANKVLNDTGDGDVSVVETATSDNIQTVKGEAANPMPQKPSTEYPSFGGKKFPHRTLLLIVAAICCLVIAIHFVKQPNKKLPERIEQVKTHHRHRGTTNLGPQNGSEKPIASPGKMNHNAANSVESPSKPKPADVVKPSGTNDATENAVRALERQTHRPAAKPLPTNTTKP